MPDYEAELLRSLQDAYGAALRRFVTGLIRSLCTTSSAVTGQPRDEAPQRRPVILQRTQ